MTTHTSIVLDARILREIWSDRDRGVEKFIPKLRNRCRNGKMIFRAFQCEMELDYITVSRLLLVPVVSVCESIKNWFQLIYPL